METTQHPPQDEQSMHVMWNLLPQDCRIKQWSRELTHACTDAFEPQAWDMTGHAVLIEAEDADLVRHTMHIIAGKSGMQLHFVSPTNMCENFAQWLDALPTDNPSLVYLEPGAWLGPIDTSPSNNESSECQTWRLLQEQLGRFMVDKAQSRPIVFVSTARSFNQLDSSLRTVNHFDRRIRFPDLSHEIYAQWFMTDMANQQLSQSMTHDTRKLGALLRYEYPDRRRRGLMQKALCRLAWREQRPLEFADLVKFAAYGTSEVDDGSIPAESAYRHAIHEAGHAVITHMDSKDKVPPTYCSVLKHTESHGIVVTPFDTHERTCDDLSYADMCHKIRVWLGGRAAEHLLLGATQVSAEGSSSDLEQATRLACSMIGAWGLPIDTSTDQTAAANLSVVIDEISPSEAMHVENQARKFLQQQFMKTLSLLRADQDYLHAIVNALMKRKFLLADDFAKLQTASAAHKVKFEQPSKARA